MKYLLSAVIIISLVFSCSKKPQDGSMISGNIHYETGNAADTLYVGLYSLSAKDFLGKYKQLRKITDGKFSFNVDPGLYTLSVYAYRYEPFRKDIFIPDTSTHIKLDIDLPRLSLPARIDSVVLCAGKGHGMSWRIEKPLKFKNNLWVFDDPVQLKKGEKYQLKVNGVMVWNLSEKKYHVNYASADFNSLYSGGNIVFDPSLYQRPKQSASGVCSGVEKKYDLKKLAEDLQALDEARKQTVRLMKTAPFEKADSLFGELTDKYDRLAEEYGNPFDQVIIENRIYPVELNNPVSRELQNLFLKHKNDTAVYNNFYRSETFKHYMAAYVTFLKRLDPASFLLKGRFVMSYLFPIQLLRTSEIIQKELNLPKDYFEKQLIKFGRQTNSKKCAVNILYTLGFLYSRMHSQKDHEKALSLLKRLKRNYPDDEKVKSGYVDKTIKGLEIDVESQAPDFAVRSIAGDSLKLSQFRGKFVLLDFWGAWCAPCVVEIPNLVKVYKAFSRSELEVIGLASDDPLKVSNFIKEKKIPYHNALADKHILSDYGISAFPTTFLIAPDGIIIAKNLRGEDLPEMIKEKIKAYRDKKKTK